MLLGRITFKLLCRHYLLALCYFIIFQPFTLREDENQRCCYWDVLHLLCSYFILDLALNSLTSFSKDLLIRSRSSFGRAPCSACAMNRYGMIHFDSGSLWPLTLNGVNSPSTGPWVESYILILIQFGPMPSILIMSARPLPWPFVFVLTYSLLPLVYH